MQPIPKTVLIELATYTSGYFAKTAEWLRTIAARVSTILEIRNTLDVKAVCDQAIQGSSSLAAKITVLPTADSHLFSTPEAMKAILSHPRNDPEGMFKVENKTSQILGLFKMLFGESSLDCNDTILTCQPHYVQKYRALFEDLSSRNKVQQQFSAAIAELVAQTILRWNAMGQKINMSEELRLFTTTAVCKVILGYVPEPQAPQYGQIAKAVDLINELYVKKMFMLPIDEEQLRNAQYVIRGSILSIMESSKAPFVERLRREEGNDDPQKRFTRIQSEIMVMTLFIGGQETSVTALTELFWQLAISPELQQRIRGEEIHYSRFVDQVILEGLRLKPPVCYYSRPLRTSLLFKEFENGALVRTYGPIPEGDVVTVCPFAAAKDPQKFPNPHQFNPDRHEQGLSMPWLPFGFGPNRCPGREFFWEEAAQLIFAAVKQFHLSTDQRVKPLSKGMMTDHFTESLFITFSINQDSKT